MEKTLIVLAHPDMSHSRLNQALLGALKDEPNITVHDLYATYKTPEEIDVEAEQCLLMEHQHIVFQFPLYWFGSPGLLKYWEDKVLTPGFAYAGDHKLAGKTFRVVTTTGASDEAYTTEGHVHATIKDLIKPLESTALYVKMVLAEPFVVYDAFHITDEALMKKAEKYRTVLTGS
ncbi:MAG: hypothetical protein RL113_249 [Pseudomonadota bacterium]|jgi:glutathione-regulated potassium-efflux system ancillary protein KefG